jgi:hypothetical protein
MIRTRLVLALLAGWFFLHGVQSAHAQRQYYAPSLNRPTLTPYLQYFRADPGVLGPYFSHVRPRLQLQRVLGRQAAEIQQQQAATRAIGNRLTYFEQSGSVRPTGTGSVFMSYSHYYPSLGSGGASAAPARSRSLSSGRSGFSGLGLRGR